MRPVVASNAAPRVRPSNYPPEFAGRMNGRIKRPLGDLFGLRNFGVNLTTLPPGAVSALHHSHSRQDEFVYVLEGTLWLVIGTDTFELVPGVCIGFPAKGAAHHLENRGERAASYLEIGDRTEDDEVAYPEDDLMARRHESGWYFTRKNGVPY